MLLEKGVAFMLAFLALFSSLSGCDSDSDSLPPLFSVAGMQVRAETMLENIIQALEEQNHTMLKDLFSKEALREIDNLDEQITMIMQFYQGTFQSFEGNESSSFGRRNNMDFLTLRGQYTVVTDKEEYRIFFIYHTVNEIYPERVGLELIDISTTETFERSREARRECREGIEWSREPGIHVYEWSE